MTPAMPLAAAPTMPFEPHEGKYGFYPCDRETFLKLKWLKKMYWRTVLNLAEWFRWSAKAEQNRVRRTRVWDRTGARPKLVSETTKPWTEPPVCDVFPRDARRGDRRVVGWTVPNHLDDLGILEAFEYARHPRAKEAVTPLTLSPAEIADLYARVSAWQGDGILHLIQGTVGS